VGQLIYLISLASDIKKRKKGFQENSKREISKKLAQIACAVAYLVVQYKRTEQASRKGWGWVAIGNSR